ncbi:MAG: type II toxin-antitoxin system RelE/ParE family toxin [SAR324 cluster bacterium]|nr:type II toxin-antitoxin system RelE/ParE family toxin [SAR324 cluster bacterium]
MIQQLMIQSFAQDWLEIFYHTGKHKLVPSELRRRVLTKPEVLDAAHRLADSESPPGNRLHALSGNREGQYATSPKLLFKKSK